MEKIMIVNDSFRLKSGNNIIEGVYDLYKFISKEDLKSRINNTILVIKPNGCKIYVKVNSLNIAISISNLINVAIELTSDFNELSIPRHSIVWA